MNDLERQVARAREGDTAALDAVVRAVKDDVYNLALRMLWHPEDAEDATQEILLKTITHLGSFRGESAFRTWVYRIAVNHLMTARKSRVEREELTFARFGAQLAVGLAEPPAPSAFEADQALLEEEVKVGCTLGMLLCLDREQRIAYVLGDIFAMRSEDAAEVLEVEPAAFRKRLSRARERLREFMRGHCGLVNPANACRCARRIEHAVTTGRVDPQRPLFAGQGTPAARALPVLDRVEEVEDLHRIAAIFQSHPTYRARERIVDTVRALLRSRKYDLLQ